MHHPQPDYKSPVISLTPTSVEVVNNHTFNYVPHLQNLHRSAVGFLPTVALREYQARKQLWIARDNGQPCGYLAWGSFRGDRPKREPFTLKIIQACIDYDVRFRDHGAQLIYDLERTAIAAGIETLSLWCASDLQANQFWHALGFNPTGIRTGGSAFIKNRLHTHWTKTLPVPILSPIRLAPLHLPWTPTGPRRPR